MLRVCLLLWLVCASLGHPLPEGNVDFHQDADMTEVLLEASDNATIVENSTVAPSQEPMLPATSSSTINITVTSPPSVVRSVISELDIDQAQQRQAEADQLSRSALTHAANAKAAIQAATRAVQAAQESQDRVESSGATDAQRRTAAERVAAAIAVHNEALKQWQSYLATAQDARADQELANAQIALSNALNLNTTNTTDIHVLLQTNSKSKKKAKQHRVSRIRTAKARQRGLQLLARRADDLLKVAKERLVALKLELHGNQSEQKSQASGQVLTTQQQVQWSESAQRALTKAQLALDSASQKNNAGLLEVATTQYHQAKHRHFFVQSLVLKSKQHAAKKSVRRAAATFNIAKRAFEKAKSAALKHELDTAQRNLDTAQAVFTELSTYAKLAAKQYQEHRQLASSQTRTLLDAAKAQVELAHRTMRRSSNQIAAVSQLSDTIKRLQSTLKHSSAATGRQLLNQAQSEFQAAKRKHQLATTQELKTATLAALNKATVHKRRVVRNVAIMASRALLQSAKLGVAHWQRALSASTAATHAAVQRNLNQAEQYLDDVQKQIVVISSKHLLSDAVKQTNLAKQNLKRANSAANVKAVIESIRAEQSVRHFVAERAAMRLARSARRRFDIAAKRVLTAHSATQASKAYSRLTKAHQLLHKVEKQLTLTKSKRMLFEARMRVERAKETLTSQAGQDTKAAQTELDNAKTHLNEVSLQVAHAAAHQLVDSSKAELFTAQQRLVMLNDTNAPQSEIDQANKAIKTARQHYDRAMAVSAKLESNSQSSLFAEINSLKVPSFNRARETATQSHLEMHAARSELIEASSAVEVYAARKKLEKSALISTLAAGSLLRHQFHSQLKRAKRTLRQTRLAARESSEHMAAALVMEAVQLIQRIKQRFSLLLKSNRAQVKAHRARAKVALLEHLIASSGKHDQSLADHLSLCRQQQQRLERHASLIQKRAAVQTARLALSAAKSKVRVAGNNANERSLALASLSRAYTRLNKAQHEVAKSSSLKKESIAETPKFVALSASQLAQQTQYARASARQAHVSYSKHQTRTLQRRRQRSINALRRVERAEMEAKVQRRLAKSLARLHAAESQLNSQHGPESEKEVAQAQRGVELEKLKLSFIQESCACHKKAAADANRFTVNLARTDTSHNFAMVQLKQNINADLRKQSVKVKKSTIEARFVQAKRIVSRALIMLSHAKTKEQQLSAQAKLNQAIDVLIGIRTQLGKQTSNFGECACLKTDPQYAQCVERRKSWKLCSVSTLLEITQLMQKERRLKAPTHSEL